MTPIGQGSHRNSAPATVALSAEDFDRPGTGLGADRARKVSLPSAPVWPWRSAGCQSVCIRGLSGIEATPEDPHGRPG